MEMRFNKYECGSIDNSTKSFGINSINSVQSGGNFQNSNMEMVSPKKEENEFKTV